ncbi:Type II secretion system (T2SS), protein M subtype b [Palleronia marisminoris]|uniref:General secretion pathway protein M n=1 Tax=Palleronia marisminoris TaxID=315423 RepID=A0A1Y5T6D7_9RHOB|nr:type II secretion system protein GspM [Palleronia marisminoris]SFH20367.1 Type II secretion system (T2SS), protein M subtype b [Palleronia marisminoris]SLN56902.1 General secretion pathway protein M [Palleronia marisminoris]
MDSRTTLLNAPRLGRKIAAVVAPLLVFGLAFGGMNVVGAAFEAKAERIASERQKLGNLNLLIAAAPGPAIASDPTQGGPEFLTGASTSLIQAAFQSRVGEIAEASGVNLLSVGSSPVVERDGTRFARLDVSMTGTNSEIVETIFAIESAVPYLTIRTARIDTSSPSADADGSADPVQLLMQLQIEGALRPGDEGAL